MALSLNIMASPQLTSFQDSHRFEKQKMFRIASWPHFGEHSPNPYQSLFYEALKPHNINVIPDFPFDDPSLHRRADEIDAIHFHWPEKIWRWPGTSILAQIRGLIGFWRLLQLSQRLGIKVIWTVHNHEQHEGAGWADRLGYNFLSKRADLLVCHSRWSEEFVQKQWQPKKCIVVPHGNYGNIYPKPAPKEEVLSKLSLSSTKPTVCCVGHIRPYKNFEFAAKAINSISSDIQLIIGGSVHQEYDIELLRNLASGKENIRLIERSLSDQEFADIVGASEAVVLPYQKITGSGALLASWSLGTGVIVPDLPYFREVCGPEPLASEFFEPNNLESLVQAIKKYLAKDSCQRKEAVKTISQKYDWKNCVIPFIRVIDEWRPIN